MIETPASKVAQIIDDPTVSVRPTTPPVPPVLMFTVFPLAVFVFESPPEVEPPEVETELGAS